MTSLLHWKTTTVGTPESGLSLKKRRYLLRRQNDEKPKTKDASRQISSDFASHGTVLQEDQRKNNLEITHTLEQRGCKVEIREKSTSL